MINKDEVYDEVTRRVVADKHNDGKIQHARCFFYAFHSVEVIREHGLRAILQAGSASWKRIKPEDDDGVCADAFGYVWSPGELRSRMAVAIGGMPEMHIWAGILPAGELVDLTTGFFPEQAKFLCDYDWPGEKPPKYFWAHPKDMGRGYYTAEQGAVEYALSMAAKNYGKERALNLVR